MTAAPEASDLLDMPAVAQDLPPHLSPDPGLHFDVAMVLVECHRDRPHDGIFRRDLSPQAIQQFAAEIAARLAPRIGGRYICKRTERDRIAERDAAVVSALGNGATTRQVMRDFRISRRLLYAILARTRTRAR